MRIWLPWQVVYVPHVIFESKYSLDESVDRLSRATKSVFEVEVRLGGFEPHLAGHVWKDEVALWRKIPGIQWSGQPYFIGKFEQRNGKTVLEGCYRMTRFEIALRIVGGIVASIVLALILLPVVSSIVGGNFISAFAWTLMFACIFGFIALVSFFLGQLSLRWISRDIDWVSARIAAELG